MKKINRLIPILLLLILLAAIPLHANAQEEDEDKGVLLLEQSLPGLPSRVTNLGEYLNSIFLIGIGTATALAVVMITIGGVQYMISASIGNKEAGKEKITAAIWGLILALASFLILNTINPDLLDFRINDALTSIRERVQIQRSAIKTQGDPWPWEQGNLIRARLKESTIDSKGIAHVQVTGSRTNEECTYVGQIGCTSVYGLPPTMYNKGGGLPKLAEDTGCIIFVTAGTEYWAHGNRSSIYEVNNSSHRPGSAVVDINDASCIDGKILEGYIQEGKTVPVRETTELACFEKIEKFGVLFQWEAGSCTGSTGSHWHVVF